MLDFQHIQKFQSGGQMIDVDAMETDLKKDPRFYRNGHYTNSGKRRMSALREIKDNQNNGLYYDMDSETNTFRIREVDTDKEVKDTSGRGLEEGQTKIAITRDKRNKKEVSKALSNVMTGDKKSYLVPKSGTNNNNNNNNNNSNNSNAGTAAGNAGTAAGTGTATQATADSKASNSKTSSSDNTTTALELEEIDMPKEEFKDDLNLEQGLAAFKAQDQFDSMTPEQRQAIRDTLEVFGDPDFLIREPGVIGKFKDWDEESKSFKVDGLTEYLTSQSPEDDELRMLPDALKSPSEEVFGYGYSEDPRIKSRSITEKEYEDKVKSGKGSKSEFVSTGAVYYTKDEKGELIKNTKGKYEGLPKNSIIYNEDGSIMGYVEGTGYNQRSGLYTIKTLLSDTKFDGEFSSKEDGILNENPEENQFAESDPRTARTPFGFFKKYDQLGINYDGITQSTPSINVDVADAAQNLFQLYPDLIATGGTRTAQQNKDIYKALGEPEFKDSIHQESQGGRAMDLRINDASNKLAALSKEELRKLGIVNILGPKDGGIHKNHYHIQFEPGGAQNLLAQFQKGGLVPKFQDGTGRGGFNAPLGSEGSPILNFFLQRNNTTFDKTLENFEPINPTGNYPLVLGTENSGSYFASSNSSNSRKMIPKNIDIEALRNSLVNYPDKLATFDKAVASGLDPMVAIGNDPQVTVEDKSWFANLFKRKDLPRMAGDGSENNLGGNKGRFKTAGNVLSIVQPNDVVQFMFARKAFKEPVKIVSRPTKNVTPEAVQQVRAVRDLSPETINRWVNNVASIRTPKTSDPVMNQVMANLTNSQKAKSMNELAAKRGEAVRQQEEMQWQEMNKRNADQARNNQLEEQTRFFNQQQEYQDDANRLSLEQDKKSEYWKNLGSLSAGLQSRWNQKQADYNSAKYKNIRSANEFEAQTAFQAYQNASDLYSKALMNNGVTQDQLATAKTNLDYYQNTQDFDPAVLSEMQSQYKKLEQDALNLQNLAEKVKTSKQSYTDATLNLQNTFNDNYKFGGYGLFSKK